MKRLLLLLWLSLGFASSLAAQAIPDSLFTAGTTFTDASGRSWAYVAFAPENETVLSGRSLAVYLKNGLPEDVGTFAQQGIISAEVEPNLLSVFLERGRQLGEDLVELDEALYELYRTRGATANALTSPLPTPAHPALPDMLSSLLMRALGDAETTASLRMLAVRHPALRMALGEAWAGPLTAANGQPVTLEVREWTAAGDAGVVARLTLTAGQPVVLPPPGPPVQVPDLTPNGDLNIKLRWGQEDNLRRQSALSSGFNVWRVTKAFATAQGVAAAAPSLAQLKTWIAAGQATRSVEQPISATKLFSPADAANLAADALTYFVTDDGNRYHRNGAGQNVDEPFTEGSEYTFFVTSRDILGRDGPPSLPGHGIVCRTLPPPPPSGLRVENHWEPSADPASATGTQAFQFFWRANTNNARDVTTYYEIYRGENLSDLESIAKKAQLELTSLIAADQLHQTDGALMAYLDLDSEVLVREFGESLWYSVRAVHVSPLGLIKSDFSPPVTIARRQREGPAAPSGSVDLNCARASVISVGLQTVFDPGLPLNDGVIRLRVFCRRLDNGIAHADLSVRIGTTVTDLGQHLFPAEGDVVVADFSIPTNELAGRDVIALCQTTAHTGALSNPKEVTLSNLNNEGQRELTFQTKTLSTADLTPGEVFSDELLDPPVSGPAAALPTGVGFVGNLTALTGRTVVTQTAPSGGSFTTWTRSGHGLVRAGLAYFSVAPVPEGQTQPALSGRVFPVREFGGEPCVDLAFNPGTGQANKLGVMIFTTARTAEYRLFRRIDDGPYTLVGQGGAAYAASNPLNAIRREDDALPVTDCTICYYAQTVDRDGNASALVRLEPCVERKSPALPKPRLAPPVALGTAAAAKMRLTWMCPPPGVERFLITVKATGGVAAKSALENANSTNHTLVAPLASRVVFYNTVDANRKMAVTKQAAGPATAAGNAGNLSVLSLANGSVLYQKLVQTSTFVTLPLGNGYAATPPFTAEFDVQPGSSYFVFVQAVRGPVLGGKGRGPASEVLEFKWIEAPPEPAVAWPARPMPEVITATDITVGEVDPVIWPASLALARPVGVRLAQLTNARSEDVLAVGNEIVLAPASNSPNARRPDPNAYVLPPLGDGITQKQGVVLYRQQVANALFPTVSGDTIQVSPLVRKIAWIPTVTGDGRSGARLIDPFFALSMETPPPGNNAPSPILHLWLLDTQGVIELARYHYYVVCFGPDGEITQTIDAGFYGPN